MQKGVYTTDSSTVAVEFKCYEFATRLPLARGDSVQIAYPNIDGRKFETHRKRDS